MRRVSSLLPVLTWTILVVVLLLQTTAYARTPDEFNPVPRLTVAPPPGLLYRTRVVLVSPQSQQRLIDAGLVILTAEAQTATVLADVTQLEWLARLGYRPQQTEDLGALIQARVPHNLARSLPAGLATAPVSLQAWDALEDAPQAAALADARAVLALLTPEQQALLNMAGAIDDDADGLTNTEEAWWCTNPLNPNSDGDAQGYTDGQEVAALLDFSLPRGVRWNYGPPFGPPNPWPNFNNQNNSGVNVCNDGDWDTIPDYAEAYVVGTRVGTGNSENTDGDKFDDGQELFGITYCPGGSTTCGYGSYPRTQDYSFITSGMPSWVRPPGDSPFVAAYPVIDFLVDPATIRVVTREIRTSERTITQGEEISTGFAETTGSSTTVGTIDTNTHSTWQENSTTEGGIEPDLHLEDAIASESSASGTFVLAATEQPEDDMEQVPVHLCVVADSITISQDVTINETELCHALQTAIKTGSRVAASGDSDLILLPNGIEMMVTKIVQLHEDQQEFAVVYWLPVWSESRIPIGSPAYPLLGQRVSGQWDWASAGTKLYDQIAHQLPDSEEIVALRQVSQELLNMALAAAMTRLREFKLPWTPSAGAIEVTQGELGSFTHENRYAYDFARRVDPRNFSVIAIKDGRVVAMREDSDVSCNNYACVVASNPTQSISPPCASNNCQNEMNYVTIEHADGTTAHYWHLQKDSVPFRLGDRVFQGEPIGKAGRTGYSTNIHLHLEVRQNGTTVPIGFDEVAEREHNDGQPIQGHSYNSQNHPAQLACYAPGMSSALTGQPIYFNQQQKPISFGETIGKLFQGFVGKLTRSGSLEELTLAPDSLSGCSGNSCSDQVRYQTSNSLNFSDNRSGGQCSSAGGSPGGDSSSGFGGGGAGMAINNNGDGTWDRLRVWSQTTTTGEGFSTSHSELRSQTEYSEITRSQTNTLVSSEAWSTATTVDPTQAATLTFNYNLYNTGSDAAVQLTGVRINVLIGDLPVITWNAPDRANILPGQAKGPFGSDPINLTLDQLAAIDNGAPIRVVLADYGYNDSLYDQDAWGRGVLFHVDDGIADGDENSDTYLITTGLVQGETYQDVLARYFPVEVFDAGPNDPRTGTLTNIRTPEFDANGEITAWNDHRVGERGWWELAVSLGGETAGVQNFKDMPAKPRTDVYLRYVEDSDGDGYSNRAEIDGMSDPNNPDIHPRPLMIAAQHRQVSGSTATVQLALQNIGNFDASSVEVWAVAPDDSITLTDNLIGGGGRVQAGGHVVLGARTGNLNLTNWATSTAKPYPAGQYTGLTAKTFSLRADGNGNIGSSTGLTISWSTDGATWTPLAVGAGYTPLAPLPLSDGLTVAFSAGYIAQNETFSFQAALPIDTFSYTINRTPHTPPLVVISYNDPAGNHKFVSDVEVTPIQADLTGYLGQMRYGFELDIMAETPAAPGANTAYLVFTNPAAQAINQGKLFVEFALPDGTVVKEYVLADQTFQPGPNVVALPWNTADFNPAFDPSAEYHILVFAADRQGTIFENTVKKLSQIGHDRLPLAVLPDSAWDFGTAQQGTLLKRTIAVANVGYHDLLTFVQGNPGFTLSDSGTRHLPGGDLALYELTLNTAQLPVGPFQSTVEIRTSDPTQPSHTVTIQGTVTAMPADTPPGAVQRPLDWPAAFASGTKGQWVEFTHTLGPDPQTLHPVKVYSQDYVALWGVGKYATAFGSGTAPYDMFGDGRDGVMPSSGNLDNNSGVGVAIVNSGSAVAYSINVTDAYAGWRINPGDVVLIHQTQGTGVGCWELNTAVSDYTGGTANIQLAKPLQCNYASGGNNHAQIQRVPQYTDCPVSGTVTPLSAWNGTWGGILAVMCNGTMNLTGSITAAGKGFMGGVTSQSAHAEQGDSATGNGTNTTSANGTGGGGGALGDGAAAGGGGGGGLGVTGTAGQPGARGGGAGGTTGGSADLTTFIFGGAGGGGGWRRDTAGGTGGTSGGIILLSTRTLALGGSSSVTAAGNSGGANSGAGDSAGGGGGGAGGSILLKMNTGSLGTARITAAGGDGGAGNPGSNNNGGAGGAGRIRIEYCESFSGSTNPPASVQKLNCYIAEQIETAPYDRARLNLPETFNDGRTYQVQYGRKLNWGGGANQVTTLRVPAGLFTSVTLQALVRDLPNNAWFALDVGAAGSDSWNGTVGNGGEYTSPNLAAFFNAYWASHDAPTTGYLEVPVRVYLDRAGQVLLTNLQVTPTGSKQRFLRLPAQTYSVATVQFTVSGGSGPLTVGVDVGDNGSVDWAWSGSATYPQALTTANLATAINAYLQGQTGDVDVPIRFYVSPFVEVNLQGVAATPAAQPDVSLNAADIAFSATTPSEGDEVTVTAVLRNLGSLAGGPLTVSFFATPAGGSTWYIGSAFAPSVPAGGATQAEILWNTLGFTGNVSVRVVVDPYNRLVETNENNNQATAGLTILTRPDLKVAAVNLSDPEPVVGEVVAVALTLTNSGQTAAAPSLLALYDGYPGTGNTPLCEHVLTLPAGGTTTLTCNWAPSTLGLHRLLALSDRDGAVRESDEGNNNAWADVYVGFPGPILLDSGNPTADPPYNADLGYGVLDQGQPDLLLTCGAGALPEETLRLGPDGRLVYRFDHLLPGHYYHLDLVLRECDGAGRHETVSVDGFALAGPVDLSDGQAHYLSLRLDPALYADRSIEVVIAEPGIDGAVVSAVHLHDIDYRYADAGGAQDPAYPGALGFGWLDGVKNTTWGTLPYQSVRVNQSGDTVRYRFDNLNAAKAYDLNLTFWQPSGTARILSVLIDGVATGLTVNSGDYQLHRETVPIPSTAYAVDGSVEVAIRRTNAASGAMVNEIALEQNTLTPPTASPLLSITKQGPSMVQAGSPILYTLAVTNSGNAAAANLVITDTLPVGATYVSGGALNAGVVSWTVPNLAAGATTQVQFTVTAQQSVTNLHYGVTAAGGVSAVGAQSVTTAIANRPPNTPANPSPADGAVNVEPSLTLSWTGGDPDAGDSATYDVLLGTTNSPTAAACSAVNSAACAVGPLAAGTVHYWQVVARDGQQAVTAGPVWSFTTSSGVDLCAVTWQATLAVQDNGNNGETLTFGRGPYYTDGLDVACGEQVRPPLPPGGFDARWLLPVGGDDSLRDLRPDGPDGVVWRLRIQPGNGGYPMTLSWNPTALPPGSFFLQDEITGSLVSIDMRAQSSYALTSALNNLCIVYSPQVCYTVSVAAGWNMLSVPVMAGNMAATALFPDANSPAYSYTTGYVVETALTPGVGYWLRFAAPQQYQICGTPTGQSSVVVRNGWNLFGPYDRAVPTSAITSAPANLVNSPYYGYTGSYQSVSQLAVGRAYWVRVSAAGTLYYNPTVVAWLDASDAAAAAVQPAPTAAASPAACDDGWTTGLGVSDAGGAGGLLTIGHSASATNGIDPGCDEAPLPPLPPGGFDARLLLPDGDASLIDLRPFGPATVWRVGVQVGSGSAVYTVTWDPAQFPNQAQGYRLRDEFGGQIVDVDMSAQNSVTVGSAFAVLRIVAPDQTPSALTLVWESGRAQPPAMAALLTVGALLTALTATAVWQRSGKRRPLPNGRAA